MTLPILYPDVVTTVTGYLQTSLDGSGKSYATGVHVGTREPNPFAAPVVTVRRVGGIGAVVLDAPRVDLSVWHVDEAKAADLALLCRAYMLGIVGVHGTVSVTRVAEFSGPFLAWDADRNLPRYLLTFEVGVRGAAL